MRAINIALDLCSSGICLLLFLSLLLQKSGKDKLRKWFLWLCAVNFSMSLSDIPNWAFEGLARPWFPIALRLGSLIFWSCSSLMLLTFTGYLIEYLSPKVKVRHEFWYMAVGLCTVHIAGSVLSIWNGMFFTVTQDNVYQRGGWFWLSQLLPFMVYALDILIFFVYHRGLNRKDFRILSSYVILPLAAEVVQMFNYGIAPLCMSVTFAILIIYINIQSERELRQEKELTEARINMMLSQIQPHFLYNALTTIRQLCDADPKQAKAAIRDFSLFLRGNMNALTSRGPIPFEQELKHTENYLNLEQQRFQSRLRILYEIKVCDFSVPSLTLQPIVENAVRHGVLRREAGGTVTIRTEETDSSYRITVSDDGVGFISLPDETDGQPHVGIANVRERLSAVCGGILDIQSNVGSGTIVTITIPKEGEKP